MKRKMQLLFLLVAIWALQQTIEIRVTSGASMLPTVPEAPSLVLVFHSPFYHYGEGDIVAAKDVEGFCIMKRIRWIHDDRVFLVGDNSSQSYDSRIYGALPISSIEGLAVPLSITL